MTVPSGISLVMPPSTPRTISFLMLILAKVPRTMTLWLPRRVVTVIAGAFRERVAVDRVLDGRGNLAVGRPDVLEIHRLVVAAVAERLGHQVVANRAGQRIGDDQRGRCQVVGAHLGMDPPL